MEKSDQNHGHHERFSEDTKFRKRKKFDHFTYCGLNLGCGKK